MSKEKMKPLTRRLMTAYTLTDILKETIILPIKHI